MFRTRCITHLHTKSHKKSKKTHIHLLYIVNNIEILNAIQSQQQKKYIKVLNFEHSLKNMRTESRKKNNNTMELTLNKKVIMLKK